MPTSPLFADLYEFTMAQTYWASGHDASATFSLFFRHLPADRGYLLAAGVDDVLDHLETLRFGPSELEYLHSTDLFDERFLEFLGSLRFTGSVRAVREGTVVFADEPVLEVTAPIIEAQIVETLALNHVNLASLLATKASRVVHVAPEKLLVDFGARRTQGIETASVFARASYLAGFAGTSNVQAGRDHGIPTFGTMAHSFISSFPSEFDAFRAYAAAFPDDSTFLVDTYDTIDGVRNAITVALEMRDQGHRLRGVRLDSGDLLDLSRQTRALLDEAGLQDVQIFATGGLDEFEVDRLLRAGAQIDGFGVGTKVGVSADAPWSDNVYKLVEYDGAPVLKLSPAKETLPGAKQVYRLSDRWERFAGDFITGAADPAEDGQPLIEDALDAGRRVRPRDDLRAARDRAAQDLAHLPESFQRLRSPETYLVSVSGPLRARYKALTGLHTPSDSPRLDR